jgi:hypothetical protein
MRILQGILFMIESLKRRVRDRGLEGYSDWKLPTLVLLTPERTWRHGDNVCAEETRRTYSDGPGDAEPGHASRLSA